ncbi:uncharacterized protein E0L32_010108 [Thyridium curvatum]|uniref:Uncharacterized protein n=1 Tax=Thyridium curvatum TaxID=1093900 RepID=A0A507AU30_9PEZI|nr:uncharacterized protein E0L32_010108 [Thyridium curvatum]TPX08378.1 hypothetical protein E0L32_010108 [Thyridium curvatum]
MPHSHYSDEQRRWVCENIWTYDRDGFIAAYAAKFNDPNFGRSQYKWVCQHYARSDDYGHALLYPPFEGAKPGDPGAHGWVPPSVLKSEAFVDSDPSAEAFLNNAGDTAQNQGVDQNAENQIDSANGGEYSQDQSIDDNVENDDAMVGMVNSGLDQSLDDKLEGQADLANAKMSSPAVTDSNTHELDMPLGQDTSPAEPSANSVFDMAYSMNLDGPPGDPEFFGQSSPASRGNANSAQPFAAASASSLMPPPGGAKRSHSSPSLAQPRKRSSGAHAAFTADHEEDDGIFITESPTPQARRQGGLVVVPKPGVMVKKQRSASGPATSPLTRGDLNVQQLVTAARPAQTINTEQTRRLASATAPRASVNIGGAATSARGGGDIPRQQALPLFTLPDIAMPPPVVTRQSPFQVYPSPQPVFGYTSPQPVFGYPSPHQGFGHHSPPFGLGISPIRLPQTNHSLAYPSALEILQGPGPTPANPFHPALNPLRPQRALLADPFVSGPGQAYPATTFNRRLLEVQHQDLDRRRSRGSRNNSPHLGLFNPPGSLDPSSSGPANKRGKGAQQLQPRNSGIKADNAKPGEKDDDETISQLESQDGAAPRPTSRLAQRTFSSNTAEQAIRDARAQAASRPSSALSVESQSSILRQSHYDKSGVVKVDSAGLWFSKAHDTCMINQMHRHDLQGGVYFQSTGDVEATLHNHFNDTSGNVLDFITQTYHPGLPAHQGGGSANDAIDNQLKYINMAHMTGEQYAAVKDGIPTLEAIGWVKPQGIEPPPPQGPYPLMVPVTNGVPLPAMNAQQQQQPMTNPLNFGQNANQQAAANANKNANQGGGVQPGNSAGSANVQLGGTAPAQLPIPDINIGAGYHDFASEFINFDGGDDHRDTPTIDPWYLGGGVSDKGKDKDDQVEPMDIGPPAGSTPPLPEPPSKLYSQHPAEAAYDKANPIYNWDPYNFDPNIRPDLGDDDDGDVPDHGMYGRGAGAGGTYELPGPDADFWKPTDLDGPDGWDPNAPSMFPPAPPPPPPARGNGGPDDVEITEGPFRPGGSMADFRARMEFLVDRDNKY